MLQVWTIFRISHFIFVICLCFPVRIGALDKYSGVLFTFAGPLHLLTLLLRIVIRYRANRIVGKVEQNIS